VREHLGNRHPAIANANKMYLKKFGEGYRAAHHYGFGLICLNRVYRGESKNNLNWAVGEFDFVINWVKKLNTSLPFLYEVWYKKGEALVLKDEIAKAIQSFSQSIKLKPDYFPSYAMLSACYQRLGHYEKAKEILEIGRTRAGKKKIKK
jgi:tetratricopeptide (TPR) repeat protein